MGTWKIPKMQKNPLLLTLTPITKSIQIIPKWLTINKITRTPTCKINRYQYQNKERDLKKSESTPDSARAWSSGGWARKSRRPHAQHSGWKKSVWRGGGGYQRRHVSASGGCLWRWESDEGMIWKCFGHQQIKKRWWVGLFLLWE